MVGSQSGYFCGLFCTLTECNCRGLHMMGQHSSSIDDTIFSFHTHFYSQETRKLICSSMLSSGRSTVDSYFLLILSGTLEFLVNFQLNCKYVKEDRRSEKEMLVGFVYLWFALSFLKKVNSNASHLTICLCLLFPNISEESILNDH